MTEPPLDVLWASRALRRYKVALLAVTALGIACGLLLTMLQTPVYVAQSVVLLPASGRDAKGNALRDMVTEVRIAGSPDILAEASARLAPPVSIPTLRERVHPKAISGELLEFAVDSGSPRQAALVANAMAEAYVAFSNGVGPNQGSPDAPGALQRQSVDLNDRTRKLASDIAAESASLAAVDPSSPDGVRLSASIASLRAEQADANRQLSDVSTRLRDQLSRQGTRVLQSATTPNRPSSPRPVLYVGIGALIGLATGSVLVLARQKIDRRVRARGDIAEIVGAPVLVSLTVPRRRAAAGRAVSQRWEPTATENLALRQVLSSLDVAPGGGATEIVAITLAGDVAGPLVAFRLAGFAGRAGIRTNFVIGTRHPDTSALRTACRSVPAQPPDALPNLRMHDIADDSDPDRRSGDAELTVTVLVLEDDDLELRERCGRIVTVLATSSGFATQDLLARAGGACLDTGHPLSGVLVANPDPGDHTTGRAQGGSGGAASGAEGTSPLVVATGHLAPGAERQPVENTEGQGQDARHALELALSDAEDRRTEAERVLVESRTEAQRVLSEAERMLDESRLDAERILSEPRAEAAPVEAAPVEAAVPTGITSGPDVAFGSEAPRNADPPADVEAVPRAAAIQPRGHNRTVPGLIAALRDDPDGAVRREAARTLADLGADVGADTDVLAFLGALQDPDVRRLAVDALLRHPVLAEGAPKRAPATELAGF